MTVATLKAELDFIENDQFAERASLVALLIKTVEARSRIPQLNEKVQG